MDDPANIADRLARDLPAAAYAIDAGGRVLACFTNDGALTFFRNLASAPRPTQREVAVMLDELAAHVAALRSASPAFDALAASRPIALEVVVWSGPMDLTLGRAEAGGVTIDPALTP